MSNLVASLFNVSVVENDELHEPLTLTREQEVRVCGVGVNLCLIHDPPLYVPSDYYTYIIAIGSVEPRSPASRAGFVTGDIVVAVDGVALAYGRQIYLPDDVAALIRGPAGSVVDVALQRDQRNLTARLVREPVGAGPPSSSAAVTSPMGKRAMPVTPERRQPNPLFDW